MKQTRLMMTVGLMTGAALLAGGCRKPPPPRPPVPPREWEAPPTRPAQARELVELNASIQGEVNQLPGGSTDEHRQIVSRILKHLSRALRLAQGPASSSSPEFRNRIGVIDSSQLVTTQAGIESARLHAAENESLRAAVAALDHVAARQLADDPSLTQLLQDARATLDPMYRTGGPMHDLVATDGFAAVLKVLKRVGEDLQERYSADQGAVPPPTPVEVPPPMIAPAPSARPFVPPPVDVMPEPPAPATAPS